MSASFAFRSFLVVATGALLAGFSDGRAQPASSALTFADVLRRVAETNPTLAAQRYQERAAEALVEQAGFRPNPTLDVSSENFAGTGALRDFGGLESTVQASQTIERGGKRERRVALAPREREIAAMEFALQRSEVLGQAAIAYVELLAAQARLDLAEEPLKLARETVSAAEARVQSAMASPAEIARARAALAAAEAERLRAQAGLAVAQSALAAMWGGRAADLPPLGGSIRVPATLPAESEFLARIAAHPRLQLQQAVIAGRRAAVDLEQAQATQDITIGGGVRFFREGSDAALVAGFSLPLPVRNRNQGGIRAAREILAGAEQAVRSIEAELHATIAGAWRELQAAHVSTQNLRTSALPPTEEAYAVVRQAYGEGLLPLIDVLDAQRALAAVRREILEAEFAYARALARVEALAGSDFPVTTALLSSL